MLEQLFKFPIVLIDGDNEARKAREQQRFGDIPGETKPDEEYDMIFGKAEYPYWDLIGIEDRWLPNRDSIEKALTERKFDACLVKFANVGHLLVPWTREKFKAEIIKFSEEYKANQPEIPEQRVVKIKTLSAEEFKRITDEGKSE